MKLYQNYKLYSTQIQKVSLRRFLKVKSQNKEKISGEI